MKRLLQTVKKKTMNNPVINKKEKGRDRAFLNKINELEERIGYHFSNLDLLVEALTHSSYMNENKTDVSNERMEFLGDSLLSIAVSEYLFKTYPLVNEGTLTSMRASLVNEGTLYEFAKQINLGSCLLLSRGEYLSKGNERPSILSDAFESLIAAIFLDSNYENVKDFVLSFIEPELKQNRQSIDYKSKLQICMQKEDRSIEYVVIDEKGPDHNKEFTIEVLLDGVSSGTGVGRSKKNAEQKAAQKALEKIL